LVLPIGKLATGEADYYLQQAQRRVDHTTSVASGVEDYYTGGPEAVGLLPLLAEVSHASSLPLLAAGGVADPASARVGQQRSD
jgi:hypothetical protein